MTKRTRSWASDPEVDEILDEISWGERSKLINKALLAYFKEHKAPEEISATPENLDDLKGAQGEPSKSQVEPSCLNLLSGEVSTSNSSDQMPPTVVSKGLLMRLLRRARD